MTPTRTESSGSMGKGSAECWATFGCLLSAEEKLVQRMFSHLVVCPCSGFSVEAGEACLAPTMTRCPLGGCGFAEGNQAGVDFEDTLLMGDPPLRAALLIEFFDGFAL